MSDLTDRLKQPDKSLPDETSVQLQQRRLLCLGCLSLVTAIVYGIIAWMSLQFEFDSPPEQRPILAVLGLLGAAFGIYLVAIWLATKVKQTTQLWWAIIMTSVVFRGILFFSIPIQEVDIYRYLWDGFVSSQGVNPFRYAPDQVKLVDQIHVDDVQLENLGHAAGQDPEIAKILNRVHFGQLPTVYPPTAQAVFLGANLLTPVNARLETRIRIMKLCLLCFDLGVLLLLIKLLRLCRLPIGLSVSYGWCPLVLKEIANSGHLDSIAVFLVTFVIYSLVRIAINTNPNTRSGVSWQLAWTAFVFAAAIGAKLYPVVLAPLVVVFAGRRFGIGSLVLPGLVFIITTMAVLYPMMPPGANRTDSAGPSQQTAVSTTSMQRPTTDPSLGLKTFLKHWEMNDFIFMLIVENLKPGETFPANRNVWFSIVPDHARVHVASRINDNLSIPVSEAPFLVTRAITTVVFLFVAFSLAWRASRQSDTITFCESAFLTLAWFWLLSPTQNPWYWMWALPLIPFVRNRAWFAISGLTLVYYLRFWLAYHFENSAVPGSVYVGTDFFDFVVTWLEFAPWLICLAMLFVLRRIQGKDRLASWIAASPATGRNSG